MCSPSGAVQSNSKWSQNDPFASEFNQDEQQRVWRELQASEAKAKRESESRYRPAAYVDDPNGYIDGETLQEQRAQEAGYLDLSVGRRQQQQGQAALQQAWWD